MIQLIKRLFCKHSWDRLTTRLSDKNGRRYYVCECKYCGRLKKIWKAS